MHPLTTVRGAITAAFVLAIVVSLIALFVFYPVLRILASAVEDDAGHPSLRVFFEKLFDREVEFTSHPALAHSALG